MSLSFDTDQLASSIRTIQKVVAASANTLVHFKVINADTVLLSAVNKGIGISINVPARVGKEDKSKTFAVEPSALLSLLAGRKDVSLLVKASTLLVVADGYEAELVTASADAEEVAAAESSESTKVKLTQDAIAFIADSLGGLDIKPLLNIDTFIPVSVRITEKGAKIVCYDNYHLAYTQSAKVTGDLDITLPYSTLALITKEFGGSSFKLVMTDSSLYAYNNVFKLSLLLPQQEAQNVITADVAFELVAKLKSADTVQVDISTEDLKAVATNMEAIAKKGEYVDFSADRGVCKVILKSTHGKVASDLRCKTDGSVAFRTGFAYLRDALSKLPDSKVSFKVVEDKMMFFAKGKFLYMIALLSREEVKKTKKASSKPAKK